MHIYILPYFICIFFVPLIISLCKRFELYETTEGKLHSEKVPTIGGLAIFISFLVAFTVAKPITNYQLLLISFILIIFFGLIDDLKKLSANIKFIIQIFIALIIYIFIKNSYEIIFTNNVINIIFALILIIWLLFITNAINLIDGLDGLASGLSVIILAIFSYLLHLENQNSFAIYTALLAAATWGFLTFNLPRAIIFMGDTGSLFLGLNISIISTVYFINNMTIKNLLIILTILAIPLIDSTTSIIRRLNKGISPFKGDLEHIHHKLYFKTNDQETTICIFFLLQLVINIYVLFFYNNYNFIYFFIIYMFIFLFFIFLYKMPLKEIITRNYDRIGHPHPFEWFLYFIINLSIFALIFIPNWIILIFILFISILYVIFTIYEKLSYQLRDVIVLVIIFYLFNYNNFSTKNTVIGLILLSIILFWSSKKIHFKNIKPLSSFDFIFLNTVILVCIYKEMPYIDFILVLLLSAIFYLYNKKYLILLKQLS